jgi:hypothetical protein
MVRRNYLALVGGLVAAMAAGCSGGPTPNSDAGPEAGPDASGPGRTYTYVLNSLTIEMDDTPGSKLSGFNLDELFSTDAEESGCNHEDFYAKYNEDQDQNCATVNAEGRCTASPNEGCAPGANCRGGVDNQLPTIVNAIGQFVDNDIRQAVRDTINQNKLALLVRISDVHDLQNDNAVRVRIYRAFPTFDTDCNNVVAGRTYQIDRAALRAGGSTIDDAEFSFDGEIVNGRLRVKAGADNVLNIPLPEVMGTRLNLPLRATQLRVSLTETEGRSGNLGGWVAGADLLRTVQMAAPDFATQAETLIGAMIDIKAGMPPVCFDASSTPRRYGGIGAGLALTMVEARIDETTPIADMQRAGTCGTTTADGGM